MDFNEHSTTIKALLVAALTLLLLIPVSMVKSLINERETYKEEVQTEISEKWGGKQQLTGPILVLPYITPKGQTSYSYHLPETFNVVGNIKPEERSRTIYNALVYQSEIKVNGSFAYPNNEKLNLGSINILWDKAFIIIGIPSLQGVKNKIVFNWNNNPLDITAGTMGHVVTSGLTVPVPLDGENKEKKYTFDFDLILNGSDALYFSPVGKETHIQLTSAWESPKFIGDFLPNERPLNNNGFDVKWDIFDYNRNYPQQWVGSNETLLNSKLGVELVLPVNQYQKTMRSVKYAILFIALTFLVFFLVELLSHKRIHPIQYLMVSFALILFYCLLLAISEHLSFGISYLISAIATISLITIYSHTIFKNIKHTISMGIFLIVLYVFLYVLLQLENLALLFGSISLFVGLAIVMFVSRKVNWYKSKENTEEDNTSIIIESRDENTPPPIK